jgi:recombination protein RecR
MDQKFKEITALFARLPGIGPRAAARITLALLDKPQEDLTELGQAIVELKSRIRLCQQCWNMSDDGTCSICRNARRDARTILVLEKTTDLESVERSGLYHGLYHVLGGAIDPVQGVQADDLRIRELAQRVEHTVQQIGSIELILATNPTSAGDMTAMYIIDLFRSLPGVRTTRLARGLATGTHLEYADEITLRYALESRK